MARILPVMFNEALLAALAFITSCMLVSDRSTFITSSFACALLCVLMLYSSGALIKSCSCSAPSFSPEFTRKCSFLMGGSALILAYCGGGLTFFSLSFIVMLLIFFHNMNLKGLSLFRNAFGAFNSSCIFILGAAFTGHMGLSLFCFSLYLFFSMAREIALDAEALDRDNVPEAPSFSLPFGIPRALHIAHIFTLAGICLSILLYGMDTFSHLYLIFPAVSLLILIVLHVRALSIRVRTTRLGIEFITILALMAIIVGKM
jgi:4-hydroxybenzoate polyprenyltransferase